MTALTADEKLLGMIKINRRGLGRLGDGKHLTKWYPLYAEGDSLSHNEMLSECQIIPRILLKILQMDES